MMGKTGEFNYKGGPDRKMPLSYLYRRWSLANGCLMFSGPLEISPPVRLPIGFLPYFHLILLVLFGSSSVQLYGRAFPRRLTACVSPQISGKPTK